MTREKDLRSSLEESHLSLLQRVSDMEKIVESGRGDVQTLAQDCQTLRKEAVLAREECEKAKRLKSQLEVIVTQLQEESGRPSVKNQGLPFRCTVAWLQGVSTLRRAVLGEKQNSFGNLKILPEIGTLVFRETQRHN